MKMKHILIVILCLLAIQVKGQPMTSTQLHLKSGYFIPFNKCLYENHEQELFNMNYPLSLGLGLSILQPHHYGFFYHLEFQFQSKRNEDTEIKQLPLFIGGKFFLKSEIIYRFNFYGGANCILCWSRFTSEAQGKETRIFGYGIGANAGFIYNINDALFFGFESNCNFIINNDNKKYNYKDIEGVDISLILGFCL